MLQYIVLYHIYHTHTPQKHLSLINHPMECFQLIHYPGSHDTHQMLLAHMITYRWLTTSRWLLEIIQNVVLQDEPSSMFALVFASLFSQPSFSLRIKECFCQVTHPRDLELFPSDIFIECLRSEVDSIGNGLMYN